MISEWRRTTSYGKEEEDDQWNELHISTSMTLLNSRISCQNLKPWRIELEVLSIICFSPLIQHLKKMDGGLAAVLKHTGLLNANLRSSISIPAYTTPLTSVVVSILVYSLVDDLEDLLKREDDPTADVKDHVSLLHQELLLSHSSIKDMRSPEPSKIEQVKELVMRIGGIVQQAEYLVTSFLVKDAPLWYVINRLTDLNHMIEPVRPELQLITHKYQFGGLKVAEYFSAEPPLHDTRNTHEVNDVTVGFGDKTTDILLSARLMTCHANSSST